MINKTNLMNKKPNLFGTPDEVYKEFLDYGDNTPLPKEFLLLYADYTYENYSGDAYILGYNKNKKQFFEVHGGHCSCNGLEGQWDEEYYESWKLLSQCIKKRLDANLKYTWCRYANASKELSEFLECVE